MRFFLLGVYTVFAAGGFFSENPYIKCGYFDRRRRKKYQLSIYTVFFRNEKKKHELALQQITKLKQQLFPNNTLQERYANFIPFYLKHGDNFIEILKENLNPLNPNFVVLTL